MITRALKELGHFTYGFSYCIVSIPAERLWIQSLIALGSYLGLKLRKSGTNTAGTAEQLIRDVIDDCVAGVLCDWRSYEVEWGLARP